MHLVVELLSEAAIKHKKPFAFLHWLGTASESIFLLDGGRTCILQLPSGGTRRPSLRYRTLYERLRTATATCVSPGGAYLAGINADGYLFVWHRDSNTLRCFPPPADFAYVMPCDTSLEPVPSPSQSSQACPSLLATRVFVDVQCERALLVRLVDGLLLVWEDGEPARWSVVTPPDHVPLPSADSKETTVDVVFSDQIERWACCSLVFGSDTHLVASTVTLSWRPAGQLLTDGQSRFSARWSVVRVPWTQVHERAGLVRHSGALVARFSRSGRLLAVAVNQRDSDVTRMVYLSPSSRAVVIADLHGAGAVRVHYRHQRYYWISCLSWLVGDALLAAVTKQGSLALLTPLAEPVPLLVTGAEASSRPGPYLLLHPLVAESGEPAGGGESPLSSARSAARPRRQRFSVAAHPCRPVLLCSSGYMVTMVEVKGHAPLSLCDRFISSSRDMLAALKRNELIVPSNTLPPELASDHVTPKSAAVARRAPGSLPSATTATGRGSHPRPAGNEYVPVGRTGRRSGRRKRVSFVDQPAYEPVLPASGSVENAAHWRALRRLCGRLMAAQALVVCQPGRCTQEWVGRAAAVCRLARQLSTAVLADGCGLLGGQLVRVDRLLPLLGRLAALTAFGHTGGRVALSSVGVLSAGVTAALAGSAQLPAESALAALVAVRRALRSAEAAMQRTDQAAQCIDPLEQQQLAELFSVRLAEGVNPCSAGPPAALGPLWRRLLRRVGSLYSRQRWRLPAEQRRLLATLLGQLQARVQRLGLPLASPSLPKRTPFVRRYLSGDWAGAAAQLRGRLESALDGRRPARASRPAHGLLYLHVSGGRLRLALEEVDAALCRLSLADGAAGLAAALRHPAGGRLLRSLARLMARFHLAAPLAVHPPHAARPEPPLTGHRSHTALRQHAVVNRDTLTSDISSNYLYDIWSPQQAFKMLVCCDLLEEAAWFAHELGDWRTALLVCVLRNEMRALKTGLPASPSPPSSAACAEKLLSDQMATYRSLPAASLDSTSLRHVLLAALLAGVPLLPVQLDDLLQQLRATLRRLPCVVPAGQPLPSAPLYLPTACSGPADDSDEAQARHQVADAVQKAMSLLRAAGLLERCTLAYLSALRAACRRQQLHQLFRSPTLETSLEGTHRQLSALLEGTEPAPESAALTTLTGHLRHLCLLLYLLQARDQLTLAVRAAQAHSTDSTKSSLTVATLAATLRPLESLPGWHGDLRAVALDSALSAPADAPLAEPLAERLAEVLGDLSQLGEQNEQRLLRLVHRWRHPPADDAAAGDDTWLSDVHGWDILLRGPRDGSAAQRLLDGCRLRHLREASAAAGGRLLLRQELAGALFAGPTECVDTLETRPDYLAFLRTVLDVVAPADAAVDVRPPLLNGWRRWHEQRELGSPQFVAGYRKMLASLAADSPREVPPPAAAVGAAEPGPRPAAGASRSAEELGSAPAGRRRGLFRCVSFSDIWRPSADDEFFLGADGGPAPAGKDGRGRPRRRRSKSAGPVPAAPHQQGRDRSWQTLPRRSAVKGRTVSAADGAGATDGAGDRATLKHPVFRLSAGLSVERLGKYERIEKLMGWFLLWRHREIRMDLVKPFSGPRIALRPTMPDILVYIWLTDHMANRTGGGRGRGGSSGGRGMPKQRGVPGQPDSSSSDDELRPGNPLDDPMLRHRDRDPYGSGGQSMGSTGYGGQGMGARGYGNQGMDGGGYGAQGPRGYGNQGMRPRGFGNQGTGQQRYGNQGMGSRGYGNQGMGTRGYGGQQMGNGRYGNQGFGNPGYGNRGMGNRGYDNQGMGNQGYGNQGTPNQGYGARANGGRGYGQRYGDQGYGSDGFESPDYDAQGARGPGYGGQSYRGRGAAGPGYGKPGGYGGYGGSSAPPRRSSAGPQVRFSGSPEPEPPPYAGGRTNKWGSWDDFRADPVSVRDGDGRAASAPVGWGQARSASAGSADRYQAGGGRPRGWERDGATRTLVAPPAGWERRDRGGRPLSSPPPPLSLPPGTPASWGRTLQAVGCGAAGAEWKQLHGPDSVEGDECFMVYDDKIVRMENFKSDRGASIDVIEKVEVYSPSGLRPRSGQAARAASAAPAGGSGKPGTGCTDCGWERWSASKLKSAAPNAGGSEALSQQREDLSAAPCSCDQIKQSDNAPVTRKCESCEWKRWSASLLRSAGGPGQSGGVAASGAAAGGSGAPDRPPSSGAASAAAASRSDLSMSRHSDRSDLLSQLSDEVRQLRHEQRQLRRELAARSRSPSPAGDVDIPELTRVIDEINDVLERGLEQLQHGERWRPRPIQAPRAVKPYIDAMGLPAPVLAAIVYSEPPPPPPPSRYVPSAESQRSGSRPGSVRARRGSPDHETDAGYQRLTPEKISELVGEEVRKALREASGGRQSQRRPRSTSPAPGRDIIVHHPARRSHSHDPSGSPPSGEPHSPQEPASAPPPPPAPLKPPTADTYREFPFLLHVKDPTEKEAARQVQAMRDNPTAKKIVELLQDVEPASERAAEPDLIERVLDVHNRGLAGLYERKADNMRTIQLLHADMSDEELRADRRTAAEIRQLDDEIAELKRALRALDSTETLVAWRSPSDELQHLRARLRDLEGAYGKDGKARRQDHVGGRETVVVPGKDGAQHRRVSEGTGSECKVKKRLPSDGRRHTQIVYDYGPQPAPPLFDGGRRSPSSPLQSSSPPLQQKQQQQSVPSPPPPQRQQQQQPAQPPPPQRAASPPPPSSPPPAAGHGRAGSVRAASPDREPTPPASRRGSAGVLSHRSSGTRVRFSEENLPAVAPAETAASPPPEAEEPARAPAPAEPAADSRGSARSSKKKERPAKKKPVRPAAGHMDVDVVGEEQESEEQPVRRKQRFTPEDRVPESTRSTPDAASAHQRSVPRASHSVFETTRAYQTSGEDKYIRADDLEHVPSGVLPRSSTTDEVEIGAYSVPEADQQHMAKPTTTRDALGLPEAHDLQQQVSHTFYEGTDGQQTGERSASPPSAAAAVVEIGPAPVPSSSVPSDPQFRTVPSWARETDAQAEVTGSLLKSYPSYLPPVDERAGAAEDEYKFSVGPVEVGINPNSIVGKLANISALVGQAVEIANEQQQDMDEAKQLTEKTKRRRKKDRLRDSQKRQGQAVGLLSEIIDDNKQLQTQLHSPPAHWIATAVPEDVARHRRHHQPPPPQPPPRSSQEDDEDDDDVRWFPFTGGAASSASSGSGGIVSSEDLGQWNPFQTRNTPVNSRSDSPYYTNQSDWEYGGYYTPGIRGSTGNIQSRRVRHAEPQAPLRHKSSSIAQMAPKTASPRHKSNWDAPVDAADSVSPSASSSGRRRASLHGPVRPTDERRHQRHPAVRNVPDTSSSLIIRHSSLSAVQEESDGSPRMRPGAPIQPPSSARLATNRSSSSVSSDDFADDEEVLEPAARRRPSPLRRRTSIRRPSQRPGSAASGGSGGRDDDDDDDDESTWRVPSAVYDLLGDPGDTSSDDTSQATEDLLFGIFGKKI